MNAAYTQVGGRYEVHGVFFDEIGVERVAPLPRGKYVQESIKKGC
jgi:hypothetical protein